MAYRKDSKNLQVEVASAVKSALKVQLKARKQVQNDAVNAALKVWISLPVEVQAVLMHSPPDDIQAYLTQYLLDTETLEMLHKLAPAERLAVFQEAKKAGQKFSQR